MDPGNWAPLSGTPTLGNHDLVAGLISALPMQERTGTTCLNLIDTSRNGTIVGAAPGVATPLGYGVDFTAASHKITLGAQPLPRETGTVAFAFRPAWTSDADAGNNRGLFGVGRDGNNVIHIAKSSSGPEKLYAGWYITGNYRAILSTTTSMLVAGTWHHFALTWSCPGVTTLYLDGVAALAHASPTLGFNTNGFTAYLGSWWDGSPYDARGAITAFAMWDRCLTGQQILVHATDPLCIYRPTQVSAVHYPDPWQAQWSASDPDPFRSQWSDSDPDPWRSQWSAE